MKKLNRNEVALAYQDRGAGARAIVFIHGLGFDHTTFGPQIELFSRTHRVIAMNLRCHGASDAPKREYAMPVLAEDTAWLCAQLGLVKPVVVGHSMGGTLTRTFRFGAGAAEWAPGARNHWREITHSSRAAPVCLSKT